MQKAGKFYLRMRLLSFMFVFLLALGISGIASAFEIPTGNEDVKLRWDNSIRYNVGYRVNAPYDSIVNNPNFDDGDRNFGHGIVQSRFDLLSELDLVVKKNYGFRVSAAGWYDPIYNRGVQNDSVSTSNHLDSAGNPALGFNDYVKRRYRGPDGELMDAFVFGNFSPGGVPVQVKVGRHALNWGESLFATASFNSVSYSQAPIDLQKGYAVPNITAKELFRPLASVSATVVPIQSLSFAAQYIFEWAPNKYPEAGTYLAPYDMMLDSAESMWDPDLGLVYRSSDIEPGNIGNFKEYGISARWSPAFLDGTIGLYFRKTTDKFSQFNVELDPLLSGLPAQYRFNYPDDIRIYGVSLSKTFFGVSVGAELSYRQNMPLASDAALIASDETAAIFGIPVGQYRTTLPDSGDTYTARGDTLHGIVNFLGLINKTPVWDSASWTVEFSWQRWQRVSANEELFKGRDGYEAIDRVSKDAYYVDAMFQSTWFHVLPGVDLTGTLYWGQGLSGNSATTGTICERAGSYMIGLTADIYSRYKVDLAFTDYFGKTSEVDGVVTEINGDQSLLKDRGFVSLTFRATF
jgi:Protein of unknown function (DUF1302)